MKINRQHIKNMAVHAAAILIAWVFVGLFIYGLAKIIKPLVQ